jgi:DNA invertase Pin-like site-specific DNA recombinase
MILVWSRSGELMRAAIYARVSTSDQNNAIQVRELTEYVERRGWELVARRSEFVSMGGFSFGRRSISI